MFGQVVYWPDYDYKAARRREPDASRSRKRSA